MRIRTSIGLAVLGIAIVVGVGGWLARGKIAVVAMEKLYVKALSQTPDQGLADGLHVGLCGAGGPMPDPQRSGPCTAVLAGKRLFIVDAGAGTSRNLALMNLPPSRIEAVFLTHYHSDHIDGLGELMLQRWAGSGSASPVPVHGPVGVEQVVAGFNAAYHLDQGYRTAHHGAGVVPPSGFGGQAIAFTAAPNQPDLVLIDEPDLKVTAFPVRHDPVSPAVGYAFTYKGRRVVISGDTAPSARLEAAAKGADLLVHEGLAPNLVAVQARAAKTAGRDRIAKIFGDIPGYHTSPEQVAAIAQRDHVRFLLFTHITPSLPLGALEGPYLGASRTIFSGPIKVGRDGDFISLPVGSDAVKVTDRLKLIH
jgi:ribonuclease Z